jgi:hypothetical protein
VRAKGNIEDDAQSLNMLKDWAIEMMIKFSQAFSPRISKLDLSKAKTDIELT